jgi:hypothetical protein
LKERRRKLDPDTLSSNQELAAAKLQWRQEWRDMMHNEGDAHMSTKLSGNTGTTGAILTVLI